MSKGAGWLQLGMKLVGVQCFSDSSFEIPFFCSVQLFLTTLPYLLIWVQGVYREHRVCNICWKYERNNTLQLAFTCSKLTMKTPERWHVVILMSLKLTLNIFHISFQCFYCYFWTYICGLGQGSFVNLITFLKGWLDRRNFVFQNFLFFLMVSRFYGSHSMSLEYMSKKNGA